MKWRVPGTAVIRSKNNLVTMPAACVPVRSCTASLVSVLCWALQRPCFSIWSLDKFARANLLVCWRASKLETGLFSSGLLGIRLAGSWTLLNSAGLEGGWSSNQVQEEGTVGEHAVRSGL